MALATFQQRLSLLQDERLVEYGLEKGSFLAVVQGTSKDQCFKLALFISQLLVETKQCDRIVASNSIHQLIPAQPPIGVEVHIQSLNDGQDFVRHTFDIIIDTNNELSPFISDTAKYSFVLPSHTASIITSLYEKHFYMVHRNVGETREMLTNLQHENAYITVNHKTKVAVVYIRP